MGWRGVRTPHRQKMTSNTLPTIDEIEAMLPLVAALESLVSEGTPKQFGGGCYFCDRPDGRGHEPFCAWGNAETAVRVYREARDE